MPEWGWEGDQGWNWEKQHLEGSVKNKIPELDREEGVGRNTESLDCMMKVKGTKFQREGSQQHQRYQ